MTRPFALRGAYCAAVLAATLTQSGLRGDEVASRSDSAEFHFARLAFGAYGRPYGSSRGEPWLRDWPEAEVHFMQGVSRLTRIDAAPGSRQIRFSDDSLFDYPVIYAVKVGQQPLGFLLVKSQKLTGIPNHTQYNADYRSSARTVTFEMRAQRSILAGP
jgi:hypothetical protein